MTEETDEIILNVAFCRTSCAGLFLINRAHRRVSS